MTENGASRTLHLQTVPFHEPGPCPATVPCAAPAKPRERSAYDPLRLNNNEARLLTRAVRAAEGEIEEGVSNLAEAVSRACRSEIEAIAAVGHVERVVTEAGAAREQVAAIRDRHRSDGAESRLIKQRWVGTVMWVATVAAAGYDTAFFAAMFLKMLDRPWSWTDPVTYASVLPGPLIAASLLLCGHGLAQAVARSRAHRERQPRRKRLFRRADPELHRATDDLPWPNWPVPLAFLLLLLVTVALWALIRARDLNYADAPIKVAFMLLLLLFNLTCVGLKVLHHNPYVETKKLADLTLANVARTEKQAVETASATVTEHTEATYVLRAALSQLKAIGQHKIDEAWEEILRARDEHGLAGELAPEFDVEGDCRFAEVKVPPIRSDSLKGLVEFANKLKPAEVHQRLTNALVAQT